KTTSDCVLEPNQEGVPESAVVPDITTTEGDQFNDVNTSPNDKKYDGDDSHQENEPESVAVKDAKTSDDLVVLKDTDIPNSPKNLRGNLSGETAVNSQDDESIKIVIEEIEDDASSGKQTGTKTDVVDVETVPSVERNLEKTPEPCIARRTRN
ncbi:hypothetical protein A2U01_0052917, partial [Trifolium medium]|nr:hypothetical protein [Trifolium medium]